MTVGRQHDNWMSGGERVALAFRTSTDGGHTWSAPTDIYRSPDKKLWSDYPAVPWIKGELHLVWRSGKVGSQLSLYHHVVLRETFAIRSEAKKSSATSVKVLP
jgi:hypothetical protein